jgi:hypothetical protein
MTLTPQMVLLQLHKDAFMFTKCLCEKDYITLLENGVNAVEVRQQLEADKNTLVINSGMLEAMKAADRVKYNMIKYNLFQEWD